MSISASGFKTRYSGTLSVAVIIGSLQMTASRRSESVLSTDERELALLLMGDREPLCTADGDAVHVLHHHCMENS